MIRRTARMPFFINEDTMIPKCKTCKKSQLECICDIEELDRDEKIKKYNKEYYLKNRDCIIKNILMYQLKNKDKVIKYRREYYLKNRKKILEYGREYYLKNKELMSKKVSVYPDTFVMIIIG
jgi:hypothetical protein